jgi:magnesium chelatase subunit H
MPKRTSVVSPAGAVALAAPIRFVIVTLDAHLSSAAERARRALARRLPNLELTVHTAAEWGDSAEALERCRSAIAQADIVFCSMMFMEEHYKPILPWLQARRDQCDAMVVCMSAGEVIRLTRIGRFNMGKEAKGPLALLKKLRGSNKSGVKAGEQQMRTLRRIPQILRFIPGPAQDVRAYFLSLQYWLAGSDDNIENLVRYLIDRYADGPRRAARGTLEPRPPVEYPEVGVYHPQLPQRISERAEDLPSLAESTRGTVGLLVHRSYVLAGNSAHYDGVIAALEARGLKTIAAFSSGLDATPAVQRFFVKNGRATIDAMVSLTGFPIVGGPAYNDAHAAEELVAALDVPHVSAHPVEFQTLEQWEGSDRGLTPVEATMMVAIPELDGSSGPMVFGGRASSAQGAAHDMRAHLERTAALAARVDQLVTLRRSSRAERRVAIVLFNFPPNAGNTGTAAHLSVFESLHRVLKTLRNQGYTVDVPLTVEELRERIVVGNSARYGAHANVHQLIAADNHVRRERWLDEIESQWGPAPGKQQSDGRSIFVLGERFGNVFVGIQPALGYEGDPMRLLFERGFAPTHAFSAFYRYLREDFAAHAVLHFGTHGSLEFMPGKQAGMSGACWPDRLIGSLPNFYLYAANNPSEGTIAKRRAAATLISYLTPPITQAGLYRELHDLKALIERYRGTEPGALAERAELARMIQSQAATLELAQASPAWPQEASAEVQRVHDALLEYERALIPAGLHVVGEPPNLEQRIEMLLAIAESSHGMPLDERSRAAVAAIAAGHCVDNAASNFDAAERDAVLPALGQLAATNELLSSNQELTAIVHALDGGFIRPAPGGDLLRTPAILPTGRNVHGFDPFAIPSAFALADGRKQAERVLQRHADEGNALPETIALVLWGTDNLKTEGGPIAQALALMGAKPRFDIYGKLVGTTLIPLAELGRPRIDVVVTVSGIFRDLLPLQTKLLAEAAFLAASVDEPPEQNFVRKHALAYQAAQQCDLETASLRVFGNADGAYGANVNHLIDNSRWDDTDELATTYTQRKAYAYGRTGKAAKHSALLETMLRDVQLAYQNLDSVELGVTTVDTYFDTLGGISSAIRRAKGGYVPIYIGDQTRGEGTVRTLSEQVALETRTRVLNPKWYEGMLAHGYEGVRQIEAHVTNTMGWSATTTQVAPWVYEEISKTFMLDPAMRERLAQLNPTASAKVANRLLEAHERKYWAPDAATLAALRSAGDELEDRIEGVYQSGGALA